VQSEIARCIVDAIHLEPGHCLECAAPTSNMQAYEYYLRGRQYFHSISQSGLEFARQMFTRATEIDPGFARAYAGLADAESFAAQWFERTRERLDAADRASRKALELAPHLAEARSSRGFALSLKGDFAAASREFERALELDPQNYEALYLYGRARFAEGRTAEAAALWLRAHDAQPDEYQSLALRVGALRGLDHPDTPAAAHMALAAIERRLELNPDDVRALCLGAPILSDLGRTQEGVALAERALVLAPTDLGVLYNTACSFARGGYHGRALELLERRMQLGATIYREWVEHDSDFDGIRDDPRFIALLARMPRLAQ
jgi:tetratricopeptide (TPR) repeat protein